MARSLFLRAALVLFLAYCAVFPGSVSTVALDAVPAWGEWMGPALLVVQGLAVICWMIGTYGARGAAATGGALLLAWTVEHLGETTGLPFGRYRYTDMLQPQIAGVVPVPITLAWLMAAFGAWQLARLALGENRRPGLGLLALTGTLVVVLDLQIETVATLVNPYWVWIDSGPYYGVPPQNFAAWWVVGFLMALIVSLALGDEGASGASATAAADAPDAPSSFVRGLLSRAVPVIPALLYILSSVMFTAVNVARGYPLAGLVGVVFLAAAAAISLRDRAGSAAAARRTAG